MSKANGGDLSERIERLIEPALSAMGFSLVRVQMISRAVLQVMVERSDGGSVVLDDCAEISRTISALLDVEDPIPGAYSLEVSSPGIDRPLVKERDFVRFSGREAKIESRRPIDGRKRFRGRLRGVAQGCARIETEEGLVEVPLADIQRAKLVMTDELLAEARGESIENPAKQRDGAGRRRHNG